MDWFYRILWLWEIIFNLIGLTIGLPILLFFYMYRHLIIHLAKIIHPRILRPMPLVHGAFALGSRKDFSNTILTLTVLTGTPNIQKYLRHGEECVFPLRNSDGERVYEGLEFFVQYFLGYPFWKRDEYFNVKNHVRNYDYKDKLALSSAPTEAELERVCGILLTHPWARNRSPWEFLLIENYKGLGQTAVLFRCDHVLGDAFSGVELVRKLTQMELPLPDFKLAKESVLGTGKFTFVLNTLKECFNRPTSFLQTKLPIGKPGEEVKVILGPKMSVDVIKTIKDHYNVCYGAVCYSALSGAIARIFSESGWDLPEYFCTRIMLPRPDHPGGLTIHALFVALQLPLKITSLEQRLKIIHDSIVLTSKSLLPLLNSFGSNILGIFPSPLLSWIAKTNPHGLQATTSVTPVSTGPVFYDDLEVVDFIPVISSVEQVGILVTIGGVNNKQRLGISIHTSSFPKNVEIGKISDYFNDEIQALTKSIKHEP